MSIRDCTKQSWPILWNGVITGSEIIPVTHSLNSKNYVYNEQWKHVNNVCCQSIG